MLNLIIKLLLFCWADGSADMEPIAQVPGSGFRIQVKAGQDYAYL